MVVHTNSSSDEHDNTTTTTTATTATTMIATIKGTVVVAVRVARYMQ